jgi:hypothetical protein
MLAIFFETNVEYIFLHTVFGPNCNFLAKFTSGPKPCKDPDPLGAHGRLVNGVQAHGGPEVLGRVPGDRHKVPETALGKTKQF